MCRYRQINFAQNADQEPNTDYYHNVSQNSSTEDYDNYVYELHVYSDTSNTTKFVWMNEGGTQSGDKQTKKWSVIFETPGCGKVQFKIDTGLTLM
jgi:prephenate dehydratase